MKRAVSQECFLEAKRADAFKEYGVNIFGLCFDETSCYRKGSRLAPDAIRLASHSLEDYSPELNLELDSNYLFDCGSLEFSLSEFEDILNFFKRELEGIKLGKEGMRLITLGGEHSVSLGPIREYLKQFSDLVILHLDAHADLRDSYQGSIYSHASIMKRVVDSMTENHELIQYGLRSGTRSEFELSRQKGWLKNTYEELSESLSQIGESRPIYLSLDLDFFDPAFLPGTGTPEPGGESIHTFMHILKTLISKNFVGADVVELAPNLDPTGNSSVFAAKVVRELIIALQ